MHSTARRGLRPVLAAMLALSGPLGALMAVPAHAASGVGAAPAVGGDVTVTRFVIGVPGNVPFQVKAIDNASRVVIDIDSASVTLPPRPRDGSVGLVSDFTGGLSGSNKTRVVIAVTEPVVVAKSAIEQVGKGRQLFLELVPAKDTARQAKVRRPGHLDPPSSLGAGAIAPPLPMPAETPGQLAARQAKPIIVVDPGHGGHDSGAMKNGIVEKDAVLAFALILRKQLEDTGRYRVLMTRETDEFISLGGRVEFAEQHKANLFIAVHADYAKSNARGATIFALKPSVAQRLKSAARESAAAVKISESRISPVEAKDRSIVSDILSDLARDDVEANAARTSMFQRSVVAYMGNSTNMRDDPDKTAAFRVLKTALFPSVLIELAYVTNKDDAALLSSDAWRQKVAGSITTAVDNYFSHHGARLPMLAGAE